MRYALDTNIIILLLQEEAELNRRFDMAAKSRAKMVIPRVVDYEIWRGFYYRSYPEREDAYRRFCTRFPVVTMEDTVWERAARLYAERKKAGRPTEDADLLIAAFCVTEDCTLVTRNTKHFAGIDGLAVENWAE